MRRIVVRTDGAARGNPGPAGAGWVVEGEDGETLAEGCAWLGIRTNNQAEYEALILGLGAAALDRDTDVVVYSDSELMVKQLNGEYRVKSEDLRGRWERAMAALRKAARADVRHVRRAENAAADRLANRAVDEAPPDAAEAAATEAAPAPARLAKSPAPGHL